jgi:hypothetical protein
MINLFVTDWAVSRRRIGKYVPTNVHPAIVGRQLLCKRPVNIYHSNECATIGRPLLGNAWVNTPDNNTWYSLLSSWCVFCGWSMPSLYKKHWRLFEKIRQEDVVQGSSVVDVFSMWSAPSLYKKQWRLFERISQEDVVQGSSVRIQTPDCRNMCLIYITYTYKHRVILSQAIRKSHIRIRS